MQVLKESYLNNAVCMGLAIVVGVLIYFAAVLKFGAMKKKDRQAMPGGRILMKFAVKLHLLRN